MKKFTIVLLCFFLIGCNRRQDAMQDALALRAALLQASECVLDVEITADYGNKTYTFAMGCKFDAHGNLSFTVLSPESVKGITGTIDAQGGNLRFDDTALAFPLLADGMLSPVSAPWILMKTLRSGYITSTGTDGEMTRLIIDETYEARTLSAHIWLNTEGVIQSAEIYWDSYRILTVEVKSFQIL